MKRSNRKVEYLAHPCCGAIYRMHAMSVASTEWDRDKRAAIKCGDVYDVADEEQAKTLRFGECTCKEDAKKAEKAKREEGVLKLEL